MLIEFLGEPISNIKISNHLQNPQPNQNIKMVYILFYGHSFTYTCVVNISSIEWFIFNRVGDIVSSVWVDFSFYLSVNSRHHVAKHLKLVQIFYGKTNSDSSNMNNQMYTSAESIQAGYLNLFSFSIYIWCLPWP